MTSSRWAWSILPGESAVTIVAFKIIEDLHIISFYKWPFFHGRINYSLKEVPFISAV